MEISDLDERHTFVIKLWQDGDEDGTRWRGHISHVASKHGVHFDHLSDIYRFINPYIHNQQGHFLLPLISRIRRWVRENRLAR